MPKLLSDHRTKALKVGPFLALGAIALVTSVLSRIAPAPATDLPPIIVFGPLVQTLAMTLTVLIWGSGLFWGWKLKTIALDGTTLTIGGLRREIQVPLHRVAAVEQSWWLGRLARITLHGESEFGTTIWFLTTRGSEGLVGPSRGVLELRAAMAGGEGDRSVSPPPPVDFAAEWKRLRRWRRLHRLSLVGCFLAPVVAMILDHGEPLRFFLIAAPFMVGSMWTGIMVTGWPCPQCGQRFFSTKWGFQLPAIFIQKCGHCGLPKGQTHPSLPATPGR